MLGESKGEFVRMRRFVLMDCRILDLQKREQENGIEDGIKVPSMEIARTFAVETIDFPNPLGLQ
jgi:hypothetical protein